MTDFYAVGFSLDADVGEDNFAYETDWPTSDVMEALENAADLHQTLRLGDFDGYVWVCRIGVSDDDEVFSYATVHVNRDFTLDSRSWEEMGNA